MRQTEESLTTSTPGEIKSHPRLWRMRQKRFEVLGAKLKEALRAYDLLQRVQMHIDQDEPRDDVGRGGAFSTVCRLLEVTEQESTVVMEEFEKLREATDRAWS
jgi:hypothetical protein